MEIKVEHLTELRAAVNQLRVKAEAGPTTWTPDPTSVPVIGSRSSTQGYGASDTNRQKYGLTDPFGSKHVPFSERA